jgi:hypothetical protein
LNQRTIKQEPPPKEVEMASKPISVMLTNEDLVESARYHGGVGPGQAFLGLTHVNGPDGKPAVVVMFEVATKLADVVETDLPEEAPIPSSDIETDAERVYAMRLLAYLYKELRHEPPHMEPLDVMEHRHIVRRDGDQSYSGEVTCCFRLFGDPDHYEEGRPEPPPPPPVGAVEGCGDEG